MGSFAHVCVHRLPLEPCLRQERARRRILGTFLKGESISGFVFQPSDIMVVGNESNGISDGVAALVTHRITIPTAAHHRITAESLNAGVAAAIIMSHWRG